MSINFGSDEAAASSHAIIKKALALAKRLIPSFAKRQLSRLLSNKAKIKLSIKKRSRWTGVVVERREMRDIFSMWLAPKE